MNNRTKGIICILAAALSWGFLPFFTRNLSALGADPVVSATMRAAVAAVILAIIGVARGTLKNPGRKMLAYFVLMGLFTTVGMYLFYMKAIDVMSTAMAAVLLYTGPAFVILFSRIIYKERITPKKLACLLLTFFGCALVVRAYDVSSLSGNLGGIALGLGAGICYSMVTVMGRRALLSCNSGAVSTWPVIFGAVVLLAVTPPWTIDFSSPERDLLFLLIGMTGSVLPLLLYNKGLSLGIEGGNASILATIEPVVATLTGVAAFGDSLEPLQIAGMLLVLSGGFIISYNIKNKRKIKEL